MIMIRCSVVMVLLLAFQITGFCSQAAIDTQIPADDIPRRQHRVLISNGIRSITADEDNVWIATDSGVSRFSQKDSCWTSYTKEDGLVSDNVYVVASDGAEIWFGTDSGVSRYRPAENKWITYREKDGLISNTINCITHDENYVWIGTDKGLARFDTNIDSWAARTQEDGLTTNFIMAIAVEKDSIWVGTEARRGQHDDDWRWREQKRRSGLNRYDKNTDSWNTYTAEEGLLSGQVSTIAADEDTVWIGTSDGGVSCYSKKDQAFIKSYSKSEILDTNNIKRIFVDGIYTWIGTANSGVYRYIKTTDTWMHYTVRDGLASNYVTSIAVSGDEVWFGSSENGLSKYSKLTQEWTRYVKASYLADNDVRRVQVDGNEVWAATARGLSRYDTETRQWTTYGVKDGLTHEYITRIELCGGKVFASMAEGLARLDREARRWNYYMDFVSSSSFVTALEAGTHSLLIGTAGAGVFGLPLQGKDSPKPLLKADQLPDPHVTCIESDGQNIWVGARDGLLLYDTESQSRKTFTQADGLASNHINVIVQNADDLWIGTTGGLSVYNRAESSWRTFTSQDGLPGANVRALAIADDGKLWVGTPGGLAVLHKLSQMEYEIRTALFSESKDSFYNNIRDIGIGADRLWLATAAGVLEFSPSTGEWWEHQAEPKRTPFIESSVTGIEFDGTHVWVSNWSSSPLGCVARFDRVSKSWLRYTITDILNILPDEKATTITDVREIVTEAHRVWFITDWGILKYDKELDTWRHYTIADGLVDNDVKQLVLGGGAVWACSTGRKVNRYDEKNDGWLTMRFRGSRDRDENPIEREGEWRLEDIERREQEDRWSSVRDVVVDDGSIWLRMGDGITFFNEYTKELKQFTVQDGMASDRVKCLEYDGRSIWLGHEPDDNSGTKGGISRYDTAAGKWTSYTDTSVLASNRIDRILVSSDLIWFLPHRWSRDGVTGYDAKRDNWFILKPEAEPADGDDGGYSPEIRVAEVASDRENIWVGSMMSGLLQFHTASDSWRSLRDRENMWNNIVMREGLNVDENIVWVGTMGGLRLYDKNLETWTTYTRPVSLTGNQVRAITADEKYVWCGTDQGISRYDKDEGTWRHFQSKGGRIQIKIGNDTLEWHEERAREGLMDNSVTGLAVDDRYLWVTTQRGANRYDKIADIWDRYSQRNGLPTNNLTAVAADGSDVWLGASKGLCRYPRMSDDPNAWVTYTSMIEIRPMVFSQEYASSLAVNKIRAVAAEKNYIWAGTERGVSRYDKKQDTWRTFTHEDGLVDDKISCIAVDENNVWFGTANGVTKFSRKTQDWITYTTESGLPSNQVTCIAIDGDSVWLGSFDAGLARYVDGFASEGSEVADRWTRFTENDGLAHNSVLSITVDQNFIWVGTRRGLTRYDKRTGTWTIYREY